MKLVDYIKREKISRAEFSRRTGISEGMISLLCRDETWLSKDTAQKILDATIGEVTPNDFMASPEAAE